MSNGKWAGGFPLKLMSFIVFLILVLYNLHLGFTVGKIGIPGLIWIEFWDRRSITISPPGDPDTRIGMRANIPLLGSPCPTSDKATSISTEEILKTYQENPLSAAHCYDGFPVIINGEIDTNSVQSCYYPGRQTEQSLCLVVYASNDSSSGVYCYFRPEYQSQLIELNRQLRNARVQNISVQGLVIENSYGQELKECQFVS